MARVHLLNTCPGDCTIIQHTSGRVTMIDICDGNKSTAPWETAPHAPRFAGNKGGFRMCDNNTNPIAYAKAIGISRVFRFVLSHPDMDHMDGFNALIDQCGLDNFWDTNSRKDKPPFGAGRYLERDWDRYVQVRDGREPGISSAVRHAGASFAYANQPDDASDGLHILAPDAELIKDCDMDDDVNDGSYVVLYRSANNRIVLPGDAHDKSWEYIHKTSALDVSNCSFLLAPHHGRDSGRSYDFLDWTRPSLTLAGCCRSDYLDYSQWARRGLDLVTSNQCGNVVLEAHQNHLEVFVQNLDFVVSRTGRARQDIFTNSEGYGFLTAIHARDAAGRLIQQVA